METRSNIRESLPDIQIEKLLKSITGFSYSFATVSTRKWGHEDAVKENSEAGFFQLMPDGLDDGFFDWYCLARQYHQFFITKENAVVNFLYYWNQFTNQ